MFMYSMRKQTYQCAKIVYKTQQQKHSVKHFFLKENKIFGFPCCSAREEYKIKKFQLKIRS